MTTLHHKYSLLQTMAIGDACGMNYEFVDHDPVMSRDDLKYGPNPKFTAYEPGYYTDDTQMTVANAKVILAASDLNALMPETFVESWLQAFKANPRLGYSKYMWQVMSESQTAAEFMGRINPSSGITSGSTMRASVFGLIDDIDTVKRLTIMQGIVTHATPVAQQASLAVALSAHFLHHGGTREGLADYLDSQLEAGWRDMADMANVNQAMTITRQALRALSEASSMSDVLIRAISNDRMSDTDTVCAIAMALASRCGEIPDDLPLSLKFGLKQQESMREVDRLLEAKFPPRNIYGAVRELSRDAGKRILDQVTGTSGVMGVTAEFLPPGLRPL